MDRTLLVSAELANALHYRIDPQPTRSIKPVSLAPIPTQTLKQTLNMADFTAGIISEVKTSVKKAVTQTVTGLAETVTGDINKWRTVLASNLTSLPFSLPPTLQTEIDKVNSAIAFTGLKVPSVSALDSDLKKALGDLTNPVMLEANKVVSGLSTQLDAKVKGLTSDVLKQIDWLG